MKGVGEEQQRIDDIDGEDEYDESHVDNDDDDEMVVMAAMMSSTTIDANGDDSINVMICPDLDILET